MEKEQAISIRKKMGEYIATMDWKSIVTTKSDYVYVNYANATRFSINICKGTFTLSECNYRPSTLLKVDGEDVSWNDNSDYSFCSNTVTLVRHWETIKKAINKFYNEEKCISEKINNFNA